MAYIDEGEWIFVEIDTEKVPYKILSIIHRNDGGFLVKFQDIGIETAERYSGRQLYMPEEFFRKRGIEMPLASSDFQGYRVIDRAKGDIGIVSGYIKKNMQDLLEVSSGTATILIPIDRKIIIRVDRKNKIIHIKAPEGLIELYI